MRIRYEVYGMEVNLNDVNNIPEFTLWVWDNLRARGDILALFQGELPWEEEVEKIVGRYVMREYGLPRLP